MGEKGEQLGIAQVPIRATLDELDKDLSKARSKIEGSLSATWQKIGDRVGKLAGAAVLGGVGAVAAGVGAIGVAAFKAGEQFDEAFDTIIAKTGATGPVLDQLQRDFREVFSAIPTDAESAAEMIAGLNRNLAATGQPLQDMSTRLLEATRLLGGDAANNTQLFTRVMGDWSVATEDGASVLDKLFVAAQKSGIGMDALMQKVVAYGSPMRLMGFTLDDAISLFAKWEKEGVNAELTMGSLRIAAGKFARDGRPLRESLLQTFEAIQKNTDASAALALGMEVFGARAGPDMVAAIREGRFEIDDLTAALATSDRAILGTAKTTADFGEKFKVLRNRVSLALEPLGSRLMDLATKVADNLLPAFDRIVPVFESRVAPVIERVTDALGQLLDGDVAGALETLFGPETAANIMNAMDVLQQTGDFVSANLTPILAGLGAAVLAAVVPAFVAWAASAGAAAVATIAAAAPVIAIIAAVGAAVALLAMAWERDWGGIRTKLTEFWETTAKPILEKLWAWLQENIPKAIQALSEFWTNTLQPALAVVWGFIRDRLLPFLGSLANLVGAVLYKAAEALAGLWQNVLAPALSKVWDWLKKTAGVIGENLQPVLEWLRDKALPPIETALGRIADAFGDATTMVNGWADKLRNLKLPSWLTPGSPTPLELGLRGIGVAMDDLARLTMPRLQAELGFMPAIAGQDLSRGGGGPVINIGTISAPGGPSQVREAAGLGVREGLRAAGVV